MCELLHMLLAKLIGDLPTVVFSVEATGKVFKLIGNDEKY